MSLDGSASSDMPGVNAAHAAELHLETMCMVMPLRLGTLLTAAVTVVFSIFTLAGHGSIAFMRHFIGGYSQKSRLVLYVIEATGVLFGICGLIGTWYCKKSYVATFNLWQVARLFGFVYMYFQDIPLLNKCEQWINNVDGMSKEYGFNPIMYQVAMDADCVYERWYFYIFSFGTFIFMMYLIACVNKYVNEVGRTPRHLLRVPKDLTSGAWYAHSLGERHYMNGMWGKTEVHEKTPIAQQNPMAYAQSHADLPFGAPINEGERESPQFGWAA